MGLNLIKVAAIFKIAVDRIQKIKTLSKSNLKGFDLIRKGLL